MKRCFKKLLCQTSFILTILSVLYVSNSCIRSGESNTSESRPLETKRIGTIRLDEKNFPDRIFRGEICRLLPVAEGDIIPDSLLLEVINLDINDLGITSLKGIEYFPELKQVCCYNNELTEVDLSKNLDLRKFECAHNKLKTIDVSHNHALEGLGCSHNQLTEIDVSNNPELKNLFVTGNKIQHINLYQNPKLYELGVEKCDLKELDLHNNKALHALYCSGNDFKELNLSQNAKLEVLDCQQTLFSNIHIIYSPEIQDPGKLYKGNKTDRLMFIWWPKAAYK